MKSAGRRSFWSRAARRLLAVITTLCVLVIVAAGTVYVAGRLGVGSERLSAEAEKAIRTFAGIDVKTTVGGTRLTFDGTRLLAIEARDVRISRADTGESIVEAGRLRFGLKLLPLLEGRVELGTASISDARITPSDLRPTGGPHHWNAALRDAEGLFDPAMITDAVFGALHRTFDFVDAAGTRKVELQNVVLTQSWRGLRADLTISGLTVRRKRSGEIAFEGQAQLADRAISIQGGAVRAPDRGPIEKLTANLSVSGDGSAPPVPSGEEGGRPTPSFGSFSLSVAGSETGEAAGGLISIVIDMDNAELDLGTQGRTVASAEIRAAISGAGSQVAIERAHVVAGRSDFDFRGVFGPLADSRVRGKPAYGFELFSSHSVVAPTDSPEPALPVTAHVTGRYEPDSRRLYADVVDVRTEGGRMMASASMTFAAGKTPGLSLALSTTGMPTSHVKQLWPWFAAHGPRSWVLGHVFGGRVEEANIRLAVPPGRLGNGIPLSAAEVNGHFKVTDTRFDVAGRMPPVRDGAGLIDFAGSDVEITLSSGTVYMPGERKVATTGGTFSIHEANRSPRIGKLEIDIKGEAPAVLQLASYEPIDVSRFFDMKPADVSGEITGHVSADIPLEPDIPVRDMRWKVSLDYKGLSLAEPIAGQMVTEADGTLVVDPESADIDASAKLNGTNARIDLVLPLGNSDVERKQEIELSLDDAARERLAPGLSTLLSGTATVNLVEIGENRQKVTMDMKPSVLSVPWIGWSKGAGVPATATFVMETGERQTVLSDFKLVGESFGAEGRIELSDGRLSSAHLSNVRFNKGDDFDVDIDRRGNIYVVSVDGSSFDARSLIKHFLSGSDGKAGGAAGAGQPVKLEAALDSLGGFNGAQLSNAKVSYERSAEGNAVFKAAAGTASNGTVSISDLTGGEGQKIELSTNDAGVLLAFLDIYPHVNGGSMKLDFAGAPGGTLSGRVVIRDFWVVNEPRLGSLAAATPSQGGGTDVDVSRVKFDVGYAQVTKGGNSLQLDRGVLRGPTIGSTFQGTLYDAKGNISVTGTFMPVYGVNRIFGEIPLFGEILGNGRDRGLIGVTYRLTGKTDKPQLEINPISAIAPGILRQIFEYR